MPLALLQSLGTVSSAPGDLHWVRSIIAISFQENTPLSARQEAIDRVKGVVVGGLRTGSDDGEYWVRIPDTTFAGIERALAIVQKLPQVAVAHPMTLQKGPPGVRQAEP
jgi:hypothetical protein